MYAWNQKLFFDTEEEYRQSLNRCLGYSGTFLYQQYSSEFNCFASMKMERTMRNILDEIIGLLKK